MIILAALDQSKKAPDVLKKAAELAKQQGATLVLYVAAENFMDIGDFMPSGGEFTVKLLEAAKAAAKDYEAQAVAMGVAHKVVVEQGVSPADMILKYAEEAKVDMIVMGSRAKTGLDRFLIGSTASKVVSHAPCSVLVVR